MSKNIYSNIKVQDHGNPSEKALTSEQILSGTGLFSNV